MLPAYLAEVAPAGPAIYGLAALTILAALYVTIGIVKISDAFIQVVAWIIQKFTRRVPFVGDALTRAVHSAEQALTNWLGRAERTLDSYVAWTWHNLAITIRWMARELERLSYQALVAASVIALGVTPKQALKLIRLLLHPLRTLQLIERKLLHLERVATQAIRHTVIAGVLPRIGALGGEIEHVIEWDIPRLRARERALTNRLGRLWHWVRAHEKIVVTSAFVGAVAVALGRLGMGWARCNNWKRIGRHVCGLPLGLIEDLLGLALAFLVVVDPVDIAKAAILTEEEMHSLVTKIADAHG